MDKRCAQCWFSRVVVSENGLHHVCCFSQTAAIRCMTGEKTCLRTYTAKVELTMATYKIDFHGTAWVEADSEEEARAMFFAGDEEPGEYEIDSCDEVE